MSWLCTTEKALRARPAELLEIAAEFFTNETQTEDAAQAMTDLGVRGWDGFSGAMETGFGNLVEVIGTAMKSVAVAAGEAEEACKTAGKTLDELEVESDALLITAEEQFGELEALQAETVEWETKRYWRNQAVIHAKADRVDDPDTYETAVRRLRDADVALYWIGTASETKRGDLAASQVVFDRIREDEELAQSDLATALSPIHDTINTDELEFSADDLIGVDIVLDIFDLAYMSITVDGKDDATAQGALLGARNAVAELFGIDTSERDTRLHAVRDAKREFGELGVDGLRAAIDQALFDGDEEELARLASLLLLVGGDMTDDERKTLFDQISDTYETNRSGPGWDALFAALAAHDGDLPLWALDLMLPGTDSFAGARLPHHTKLALAAKYGLDPHDPNFAELVVRAMLESDAGQAAIADYVENGGYDTYGSKLMGEYAFKYLQENPGALDLLAVKGEFLELQGVIDTIARYASPTEMETLLYDVGGSIFADIDTNNPDALEVAAKRLGLIYKQFEDVGHTSTFDPTKAAQFVVDQALARAGTAGTVVTVGLTALGSVLAGFERDGLFEEIRVEEDELNALRVMAIGVISNGDGNKAQQLADAMAPLPGEDFGDVMARLNSNPETNALFIEIETAAGNIGEGFSDAGQPLGL